MDEAKDGSPRLLRFEVFIGGVAIETPPEEFDGEIGFPSVFLHDPQNFDHFVVQLSPLVVKALYEFLKARIEKRSVPGAEVTGQD